MTDMLPAIQIFGVYDRGVPNQERVVLRVNKSTNLAPYLLVFGFRGPAGADTVIPIPDQSLWLGATTIEAPSWVFIFTGSGSAGISQERNTKEPLHSLYWNKPHVVMTHDDIVPALLHVDYVQIGNKPNMTLADCAKQQEQTEQKTLLNILAEFSRSFDASKNITPK